MSILPNDVSWLASLGHVDLTAKEGLEVSEVRILNGFIVNVAATFALFGLEREENSRRGSASDPEAPKSYVVFQRFFLFIFSYLAHFYCLMY